MLLLLNFIGLGIVVRENWEPTYQKWFGVDKIFNTARTKIFVAQTTADNFDRFTKFDV